MQLFLPAFLAALRFAQRGLELFGNYHMKRISLLTLLSLLASCTTHASFAAVQGSAAFPAPDTDPILHRGINLGNMLEAPNEGDWGLRVRPEYLKLIKEARFDFVRLPVRWSAHADAAAPYAISPSFLARVDEIVGWALANRLAIILDFQNYEELMTTPSANLERFLGIWRQLADHYKASPPQVMFELLNEPHDQLNTSWNDCARQALGIIRSSNPDRLVVLDAPASAHYAALGALQVPDDPHIIASFHFYDPFPFTHQGANWLGADTQGWLGTSWQGTDAERAYIQRSFDSVSAWARLHHVRVLLGEFGSYSTADLPSRVRWTSFVARLAEQHGFPWAYWEFAAGFGVYDPRAGVWRTGLLQALIPPDPEQAP